jgi:EAL domain-containing protein (putative c-di-GMP-specific phosphodiesterase class I)
VETMEHAKILKDLGCHILQGYALARPMTSEQLIEFCRDSHALQSG